MLPRLVGLAALFLLASPAFAADEPVLIAWPDLVPKPEEPVIPDGLTFDDEFDAQGDTSYDPDLGGVVQHGMTPAPPGMIDQTDLVAEYNDVQLKIAGHVLPIDFESTTVMEFLLVPYIGACIHVPPPPPNQIIYVTSEEGIEVTGMFEPVWAAGVLKTTSLSSELADIGYLMELYESSPYEC